MNNLTLMRQLLSPLDLRVDIVNKQAGTKKRITYKFRKNGAGDVLFETQLQGEAIAFILGATTAQSILTKKLPLPVEHPHPFPRD